MDVYSLATLFYSSAAEHVLNVNALSGGDGDFWYPQNKK